MPTLTNARGELVDLDTGEIVGRTAGAVTEQAPRAKGGVDIQPTSGSAAIANILDQTTWGLQSALFALPDAATLGIGKALGMDAKDVVTLGKMFKGVNEALTGIKERAPQNTQERYARAIGEGIGAGLPITGLTAALAASRPMYQVAKAGDSIWKGVANDAIQMFQKNPRAAVALDTAFGSAYEGLRQAVEENVDPNDPYKELYKEFLPQAALIGGPLLLSQYSKVSPTGIIGRFAKKQYDKMGGSIPLGEVEKEVLDAVRSQNMLQRLPGMRIAQKMFMNRAEQKLTQVFGPIAESPEAQAALKRLEEALADPRIAEAGFQLDAAEKTMFTPLVQKKIELLQGLGPTELAEAKKRINANQKKLNDLFQSFAPEARMPIQQAFEQAQADRQAIFEALVKSKKDLTDAEVASLSERLGPQNMDMLNNELRGAIMGNMEIASTGVRQALEDMGLSRALNYDGTLAPTRDMGTSLFGSTDMESAVKALIKKYLPERPSVRRETPEPINLLRNFVMKQEAARQEAEKTGIEDLYEQGVVAKLRGLPDMARLSGLEGSDKSMEPLFKQMRLIFDQEAGLRKLTKAETKTVSDLFTANVAERQKDGTIKFYLKRGIESRGIPEQAVTFKPKQIVEDARMLAAENSPIDINVPEALDYLQSAIRFRHDALNRYNAALMSGRGTRIADAKQMLDQGDAVFRDVEKLIKDHVPKVERNYAAMDNLIKQYKATYEQYLPVLLTSQKRGGQTYLLPNEDLLQTAFRSAENLRQITKVLGPEADQYLEKGALDWLRTKNIYDKNGVIDPTKIRKVIDSSQNIMDALPVSVRTRLDDEIRLADEFAVRSAEIDSRITAMKDAELDKVLSAATRAEADPRQTLTTALRDPAVMRKLVTQLGKDPEMLNALRRATYDIAVAGADKGASLNAFLQNNERSLKVLFGDKHLQDLRNLGDIQQRVNAFANVTGQIPAFQSMDESLKSVFGSGIQYLTTTMREALVGRIKPETGALALAVRLLGGTEQKIFDRIFTRALEDPAFAARMTAVGTPAQAADAAAKLQQIGVKPSFFQQMVTAPGVARATAMEATDLLKPEQKVQTGVSPNLPVMRQPSAKDMLRQMGAPATRGLKPAPSFRAPTTPPATATNNMNIPLMYPSLFPNDPISGLLQARQAQLQGVQR